MINFAHTPEDARNEQELPPEVGAPTMPESLAKRFSGATHELMGSHIEGQPSFSETQNRFAGHLDVPPTNFMPGVAEQSMITASTVPQAEAEPAFNSGAIARNTTKAFAGGGILAGTVSAGSFLATTGLSLEAASLAAGIAAPLAISAAIVAGSTYLGGALHNLVWHHPGGKRPGFWGTLARGVIAPISVPVGVVYQLVKG